MHGHGSRGAGNPLNEKILKLGSGMSGLVRSRGLPPGCCARSSAFCQGRDCTGRARLLPNSLSGSTANWEPIMKRGYLSAVIAGSLSLVLAERTDVTR